MEIELTRIFVKVVQNASFSRAAELLRLPKSTVSRAVSRLERETGTKLLMRTTRSLTLTPAGRVFFEASAPSIQVLEEAHRALDGGDKQLAGLVRITAPEDLGSEVISPSIGRITRENASIVYELNYTDAVIDLVKEGYDLAVRIGRLTESAFKARKVGEVRLVTVASPAYLAKHPRIRMPYDLAVHDGLAYRSSTSTGKWQLRSKNESASVSVRSRIVANQMTSLVAMAEAGAGIAFVPHYLCRREIAEGRLKRVLPGWTGVGLPVSLISPLGSAGSARLKLTADRLATDIAAALAVNDT